MWIKNLAVFRESSGSSVNVGDLESALKAVLFTPCKGQEVEKMGVVPVIGDVFAHKAGNAFVVMVRKEKRSVPGSIVKRELNKRVAKQESELGKALGKNDKDAIKESILKDLLPRAFPSEKTSCVLIYPDAGLICVESGSWKEAENVIALLRKAIGSLPVKPALPKAQIDATMTEWVKGSHVGAGFKLLDEVEIRSVIESKSLLKGVNRDLEDENLLEHIRTGDNVVSKVSLEWRGALSVLLCDDGMFKKLKWSDELTDQNEDIPKEENNARLDADYHVMSVELASFIDEIYPELGGYSE